MASENSKLNDFLSSVCQYMGTWNSYANVMDNFSIDKVCPEPYGDFKKLLKLFYRALDLMHKDWFNMFFAPSNFERNVVHVIVKVHCFAVKKKCENVFICFLYMCSFTYSLLHYCEKNGMNGMLNQVHTLLTEAFPTIESWFMAEGGWYGLKKFCSSENLPRILHFISRSYCEKAIFLSYIHVPPNYYNLGLHDRETIDLLMNNIEVFESSVRDAFEREINANLNYKQIVENAFSDLRKNLNNGPSQICLANDRANLAVDPTSPLSRI